MTRSLAPLKIDPTGADIHREAAEFRTRGPLALVELPGGVCAWSVMGFDLLRKLLLDSRVSRDAYRHWPDWIEGRVPADWPLAMWVSVKTVATTYGAEHRGLRAMMARPFALRPVQELRSFIQEVTSALLDELAGAAPGEPVDLREALAYPLPIEVFRRMFGIPAELRADLRRLVSALFRATPSPQTADTDITELYELMETLVACRRAEPDDALVSTLIDIHDSGGPLTHGQLMDTLVLMISAGYETTANLIDHAVVAMLTHPSQLELVRSGRNSWSDVIEETLRWQAPVAHVPLRYAVDDITVGTTVIRKGEPILAAYAAAGRDTVHYGPDADTFDITRRDKTHLSFGVGEHNCSGKHLVRLEVEIALSALFERFPGLRLAVPAKQIRPLGSFLSNGHRTVPVFVDSASREGRA